MSIRFRDKTLSVEIDSVHIDSGFAPCNDWQMVLLNNVEMHSTMTNALFFIYNLILSRIQPINWLKYFLPNEYVSPECVRY